MTSFFFLEEKCILAYLASRNASILLSQKLKACIVVEGPSDSFYELQEFLGSLQRNHPSQFVGTLRGISAQGTEYCS
jgi:hypothetical protein